MTPKPPNPARNTFWNYRELVRPLDAEKWFRITREAMAEAKRPGNPPVIPGILEPWRWPQRRGNRQFPYWKAWRYLVNAFKGPAAEIVRLLPFARAFRQISYNPHQNEYGPIHRKNLLSLLLISMAALSSAPAQVTTIAVSTNNPTMTVPGNTIYLGATLAVPTNGFATLKSFLSTGTGFLRIRTQGVSYDYLNDGVGFTIAGPARFK